RLAGVGYGPLVQPKGEIPAKLQIKFELVQNSHPLPGPEIDHTVVSVCQDVALFIHKIHYDVLDWVLPSPIVTEHPTCEVEAFRTIEIQYIEAFMEIVKKVVNHVRWSGNG